jgi:hypothetical protein
MAGIGTLSPDQITRSAVEQWRDRAMTKVTVYRPQGANTMEGGA